MKPKLGKRGPKSRAGGAKGAGRKARAPKGSSGSPGGKMHHRLTGGGSS